MRIKSVTILKSGEFGRAGLTSNEKDNLDKARSIVRDEKKRHNCSLASIDNFLVAVLNESLNEIEFVYYDSNCSKPQVKMRFKK